MTPLKKTSQQITDSTFSALRTLLQTSGWRVRGSQEEDNWRDKRPPQAAHGTRRYVVFLCLSVCNTMFCNSAMFAFSKYVVTCTWAYKSNYHPMDATGDTNGGQNSRLNINSVVLMVYCSCHSWLLQCSYCTALFIVINTHAPQVDSRWSVSIEYQSGTIYSMYI